jgi:hypothetical protein
MCKSSLLDNVKSPPPPQLTGTVDPSLITPFAAIASVCTFCAEIMPMLMHRDTRTPAHLFSMTWRSGCAVWTQTTPAL